jgi:hypothetical protein
VSTTRIGSLYQDDGGIAGAAILSPGTFLNGTNNTVYFVPATNQFGSNYDTFDFSVNDGEADSISAAVTLAINLPPLPSFITHRRGAEKTFELNFQGGTNGSYHVFASTNLMDWESIAIPQEISPGSFQWIDSSTSNLPQRFYRIGAP